MSKSKTAFVVAGGATLVLLVFLVSLLLIKALWSWTVPDLFPGAVEQGLIAGSISWGSAAKLAIFAAVLFGLGRGK